MKTPINALLLWASLSLENGDDTPPPITCLVTLALKWHPRWSQDQSRWDDKVALYEKRWRLEWSHPRTMEWNSISNEIANNVQRSCLIRTVQSTTSYSFTSSWASAYSYPSPAVTAMPTWTVLSVKANSVDPTFVQSESKLCLNEAVIHCFLPPWKAWAVLHYSESNQMNDESFYLLLVCVFQLLLLNFVQLLWWNY